MMSYPICTTRSGNVRHRCGGGSAGGGSFPGEGVGVGDESVDSCGIVRALRTTLVIDPVCRMYVGVVRCTDELLYVGYKWVSRFEAPCIERGRALSETGVQAPWHDVLETVWLHCDEAQQVACLRGWESWLLK